MKHKKLSSLLLMLPLSVCLFSCASSAQEQAAVNGKNEETMEENQQEITLSYPSNGQNITILKPAVLDYILAMKEQAKGIENDYVINNLNGDKVKVKDYYRPSVNDEKSKKIPLIFDHTGFENANTFNVYLSKNSDMSDAKVYQTTDTYVTVDNLLANQTYYWQVKSGEVQSEVRSFLTDGYTRMITADYVNNVRDIGCHEVKGGKHIKQGLIFRGGELVYTKYGDHGKSLSDEAIRIMTEDLGIKAEYDFRGAEEANNITESDLCHNGAEVEYYRYSIGGYGSVLTNSHHFEELKSLFLAFSNAENKHVYFHCWGGADRTGTIGFLLGALLGMSYTDLVIDYELTSYSKNYRPHDETGAYWDFPGLISTIKNSTYYSEGKELSEFVKDWMIGALGMTEAEVTTLKANLLED